MRGTAVKGVVFVVLAGLGGGCDVVPRQEQAPAASVSGAPAAGSGGAVVQGGAAGEAGEADGPDESDEAAVLARALARGREAAAKVAQQQGKGTQPTRRPLSARRGGCDEITCLIDPTACGGGCVDSGFRRPRPPVPSPPDTLSREDIIAVVSPLRARVRGCDPDGSAAATSVRVRVTVAAGGRPSEVKVLPPVDGAVSACIERMVRGARFRATTGGPTTFTFPFVLGR